MPGFSPSPFADADKAAKRIFLIMCVPAANNAKYQSWVFSGA